jgi:hypothetical protein
MTCPKWHFGQVGHGGKKTIWGSFFTKIPKKKPWFFKVFLYLKNFIDKVFFKLVFFNPFVKLQFLWQAFAS